MGEYIDVPDTIIVVENDTLKKVPYKEFLRKNKEEVNHLESSIFDDNGSGEE